uniref:Major facilitator superfamily (MFS) profile domain-containing protein n=1 Tax=Acrobeloides nanus TaxID=290746 RepID=A0A914C3D8_9BILA
MNTKNEKTFPFWSFSSMRFMLALLLLFVCTNAIFMRGSLSFGIVCMVDSKNPSTNHTVLNHTTNDHHLSDHKCIRHTKNENNPVNKGTFKWNSEMQEWLFTATYIGTIPACLISGYLADRHSPKYVILFALLLFVLLTLLGPMMAQWSYFALLADRSLIGIAEGLTYPPLASLTVRWFSQRESIIVAAMYTSGSQIGNSLGSFISSQLCSLSFLDGWPLIFYLYGTVGLICAIIWFIFAQDTPEKCNFMSEDEKLYLYAVSQRRTKSDEEKLDVPWFKLLTSMVTLSIVFSHFVLQFQVIIFHSFLPLYFRDVLYLDPSQNGLYLTIIYLSQLIAKNAWAIVVDKFKAKNIVNMTTTCKMLESICGIGTTLSLLGLVYMVDCTKSNLALVFLTLYSVTFSAHITGSISTAFTIAPLFTGIINSLAFFASGIACLMGLITVTLLNKTGSKEEWNNIFWIIILLNLASSIFFMIFGSAEMQPWAKSNKIVPAA